jgi:hypothetical protein
VLLVNTQKTLRGSTITHTNPRSLTSLVLPVGARHTAHRSMGHTAERLRCAPGVQSRACARFPPLSHTNNPSIINLQIKKKAQIAPPPTYADLMMIYAGARPPDPPPRTPSAWLRASRIPAEFMQGMQPRWAESRDSGDN